MKARILIVCAAVAAFVNAGAMFAHRTHTRTVYVERPFDVIALPCPPLGDD